MTDVDELYVLARSALLDALHALAPHRESIVLVGAQAIYLRVGQADVAVAPFTTDGDLALEPATLAEIPPLEFALRNAGFSPKTPDSVGIWITRRETSQRVAAEVAIDLLVPASIAPPAGRRAARLHGHDARAARIVRGLDGAVVDADVMTVIALDARDGRAFDVRVAGPAALLVAKVHKIGERHGTDRQSDKDALDVLRLLRGTETGDLARRYVRILTDKRSEVAATLGRDLLKTQFAERGGIGVEMAVRSAGVLGDADEIAASCKALASDLLAALR